jgi:hypothetical protein
MVFIPLLTIITLVKKIFVFILALLYITTSSGVMINMHYCMGELTVLGLSHNKDEDCSNCGMKESERNACCKDKQQFLKINKEQNTSNASYQLPEFTSDALVNNSFELISLHVPSLVQEDPLAKAPPRRQNLPLFILNCVFRI